MAEAGPGRPAADVLAAFAKLGCTSFGGPAAHLAYFHKEFVERRRWLDDTAFAQIVAIAQFLPGPASSQAGILIGHLRAGVPGALLAWLGFTAPSAIVMLAFAFGASIVDPQAPAIHGLLVAAVAVVAAAVVNMATRLYPDLARRALAVLTAMAILVLPQTGVVQLAAIVAGAAFGTFFLGASAGIPIAALPFRGSKAVGVACLVAYAALLAGLPALAAATGNSAIAVFAAFYHAGALIFGGGHVMLPLLREQVVPPGWIDDSSFLAGYGAAQALPGPLVTFSVYLGASLAGPVHGIAGAALALAGIYVPTVLLLGAVVPFWGAVASHERLGGAMRGVNAAVVGVLVAALYRPIWVSAIHRPADIALAAAAFALLQWGKAQPVFVVMSCAAAAAVLGMH